MMLNRASTARGEHRAGTKERQHDGPHPDPQHDDRHRGSQAHVQDPDRPRRGRRRRRPPRRAPARSSASSDRTAPGKTTTLRMLATLITPTAGEATVAGADLRRQPGLVRQRIGYVPQGGSTDPAETGRGELVLQGRLYGMNTRRREGPRDRGPRRARSRDGRRPPDRHVLRRHAPPARRRPRDRPPAAGPLPRRADDRPRSAGAGAHVGGDPEAPRAGDDGLPHDPLPRGGRRAVRPPRDHRPRPDRRRGHVRPAQAEGRRRRRHDRRQRRRARRC